MQPKLRSRILLFTILTMIVVTIAFIVIRYARFNTPVKIGSAAPDIQEDTVSGQAFSLASLRGKPVLLNFFTPWCQPCIDETPDLAAFSRTYGDKVRVVMIDRGDGPAMVKQFVSEYHIPRNIIVLMSPYDKWSHRFGVTGQPETFFITKTGVVASHLIGPLTQAQMAAGAKTAGLP